MIRKISITGPESTGKTTLARSLAEHFGTLFVPEYSRNYLAGLNRAYTEEDLLIMARGQATLEDELKNKANTFLFCDSDMLVMCIWSLEKYGTCHPWIREQLESRTYDLYLLCAADLPWEPDPLRENPDDRDRLLDLYIQYLEHLKVSYRLISGTGEIRQQKAITIIEELFGSGI